MPRFAGLIGSTALLLAALVAIWAPWPAPAQQPPAGGTTRLPSGYVGLDVCIGCHTDSFAAFAATRMGRLFLNQPRSSTEKLVCETCHGPGEKHATARGGQGVAGLIMFGKNDKTPPETLNTVCLSCHTKGAHLFWKGSAHETRDVACTSCHTVMKNLGPHSLSKETVVETCGTCHLRERAQMLRSSHMPVREGKMTCTSCHDAHGSVSPSLLKQTSVNDTCFKCHQEKRGPFLWSHAPVTESCTNCHDVHGSNHRGMLKANIPRLCQQCHVIEAHPTAPYGRGTSVQKFVMGSSCINCHSRIHGSNHPAGHVLTR